MLTNLSRYMAIIMASMVLCLFSSLIEAAQQNKPLSIQKEDNRVMISDKNKANPGDVFLLENKQKAGVISLADGLQYKILVEGKGEKPKASDRVEVHYEGRLINGNEFDSSYKRGEPAIFPVNAVIAGWVEALQLMPVGSTWELYIPAHLAYGERGAPPVIGSNETLIFKVELLKIVS